MYKIILKNNGEVYDTFLAGDIHAAYKVAIPEEYLSKENMHMMMYPYAKSEVEQTPLNVEVRVAWQHMVDSENNLLEAFIVRV